MDSSLLVFGAILAAGSVLFLLFIRLKDLPAPTPVSPFKHLDERKASIYENLRDLQFEYRVGKLSDSDYQAVKLDLQKELAHVLAEIDRVKTEIAAGSPPPVVRQKPVLKPNVCPSCGATFEKSLKFCGECGKPMSVAQ